VSDGYRVRRENDCVVIEGWIPVTDLVALTREWNENHRDGDEAWIVDSVLAQHLKCNMVMGTPRACLAWRQQLGLTPEVKPRQEYLLTDGGIYCCRCGLTSHSREDIRNRYCGSCKTYLRNDT
jgi:hypothetical protein